MSNEEQGIWYFAYGSNLDPERFRDRVGSWRERRPAVLDGWRLRFSGDVRSEGGGGAFVEPRPGARTWGAVLLLDRAQMEAMDAVELDPERNVENRGIRRTVSVKTDRGEVEAEVYTVPGSRTYLAPSERYLGHILTGLEAVGHEPDVIQAVRDTAAAEPAP